MTITRLFGAALAAGCGCLAYGSLYERGAFTVRRFTVPVLPPGSDSLRLLHISDPHMTPAQHRKQQWIRKLAELDPDFVISTGDNLAHVGAVEPMLHAYGDLLDLPGAFVFGSNDYFAPEARNPFRYFWIGSDGAPARKHPDLPFEDLRSAFVGHGWKDLNNHGAEITVNGKRISFAGVDDPHLGYDVLDHEPADATADVAIGVAHAPYLRVLDRFNELGYPLLIAGHTHGGQVCVPGFGALVTNCDLDRHRAKGLHHHRSGSNTPSWLHVSAGLGTNPYTPLRFACRPEACLLTLTAIDSGVS